MIDADFPSDTLAQRLRLTGRLVQVSLVLVLLKGLLSAVLWVQVWQLPLVLHEHWTAGDWLLRTEPPGMHLWRGSGGILE